MIVQFQYNLFDYVLNYTILHALNTIPSLLAPSPIHKYRVIYEAVFILLHSIEYYFDINLLFKFART